jgi:flagellar basal-body rod protein FlgG
MSLAKRAAAGFFSLLLVTALLVAGHKLARREKRSTPPKSGPAATASAIAFPMPDCKMPEAPPASGPVGMRVAELFAAANDGDESQKPPAETGADAVVHAVSDPEPPPAGSPPRIADAFKSSPPWVSQPPPLPARTNAVPLNPEGPEFPPSAEPPGSGPSVPGLPRLELTPPTTSSRRIIDRALPNFTSEQREIWHNELKDLSPKDVRETLRLRQELGPIPSQLFDARPPWTPQQRTPATANPPSSEPLLPPSDGPALLPDAQRDASRTIAASLDALATAQQVLLNNIANARTDGYKRIAIAFESMPSASSATGHSVGVGIRLASPSIDRTQGRIRHTDRPLDFAIEGEGFFQLEDPRTRATFYTRCGRFSLNSAGQIIWRSATHELRLSSFPEIAVSDWAGKMPLRIGFVQIPALTDLIPIGENLFVLRDWDEKKPLPTSRAQRGGLRESCLEESNVDVDHELHELDDLRQLARTLEVAAQGLPIGPRDLVAPPGEPMAIPSHFAGSIGSRQ